MSRTMTTWKGAAIALLCSLSAACVVEPVDDADVANVDYEIVEDDVMVSQTDELRNPEPQPWRNPGLNAQGDSANFDVGDDDEDNPEPQPWAEAASQSNPEPQPWLPNPDDDDGGGDRGEENEENDDGEGEPAPVPWHSTTMLHFTDRD